MLLCKTGPTAGPPLRLASVLVRMLRKLPCVPVARTRSDTPFVTNSCSPPGSAAAGSSTPGGEHAGASQREAAVCQASGHLPAPVLSGHASTSGWTLGVGLQGVRGDE